MSAPDEDFMRLALAEGRKALPACLPNPPVGCVFVRDGAVIASGFTPSCAKARVARGLRRVVVAMLDPTRAMRARESTSSKRRAWR
ncbi:hypothetical protein [Paracidovorax sp. MALMAid1276]|uniref:hypothetical protein n=1 Tax=Paracidovorax sp. MALMAid1276 TaxID=3411631 RepID=UPI003B9B7069